MIKKSFIHIKGISKEKEQKLWQSGVKSWEDLINNEKTLDFNLKEKIIDEVTNSIFEYEKDNMAYFAEKLPRSEHWRIYPELKNRCCFLDIETTGLSKSNDIITIIGLHDGKESKVFVEGKNMNRFVKEVSKYDLIVTFNGACFDLPFIRNKHPNVSLPKFHVDLRYALRRLGYFGGLKNIEKEMGIVRGEDIKDIDGFEAVRLWKAHKRGDKEALSKLIAYNIADIQNLKPMMDFAFEELSKKSLNL